MNRTALVMLAVLLTAPAGGLAARAVSPAPLVRHLPTKNLAGVTGLPGDTVRLDSVLSDVMSWARIPGMATMVVKDGRVIWNKCYGYAIVEESIPVTDTTCFTLASVSKTVTGMAMMQLSENGYYELDGDINESLPFAVRHSAYPDSTITYKMLMTHTSGICDNWPVILSYSTQGDPDTPLRTFLEDYFVPGRPGYDSALNFYQNSPPGANCAYCNAAFTLLGLHVETMIESFPVYTRDSIFEPLGMDRTTWFFADLDTMSVACPYQWVSGWRRFGYQSGSFYPVAALKSCTRDLGTYLNMWLAYGRHDSLQLLDSATVELMLTPHVWDPASHGWQGLVWYQETINGDTVWCHAGGWNGVCTYVALSRRDNSGVIALTNGDASQVYYNLRGQVVPALHGFAVGIAEEPGPSVDRQPRSTFVRGVLELRVDSRQKASHRAELLDAAGRKVAELRAGTNDVSRLSPGVYFVREAQAQAQELRRILIVR